ncbi:chloramphenicol acetyltransferase [Flaviaesturariibacter aridisoli]|uniref:Chloramphenicol acetyltransferase n=1 Tax=Flaviaesturariibacter aridisoli TaxID=2545761 RepID=A0A4R4E2K4_9BACT|nr:chloramphenicol acetyltransferase [Flaviaesturariibacter aridisoli]TCZ73686.1 chloramphenicol acetyltransferase [Flaviaesturariibacter aridisoli]
MPRPIDLATWPRRDHFQFFRRFEEPFFGLCVELDCTAAYRRVKEEGTSFFLHYLWCSLKAANETEPFRYRISGDEVLEYESVHASPTINRPDGTFGFAYMDYQSDRTVFLRAAALERDRVQAGSGLVPAVSGENVIHYSSMPWIRFTGLSHARAFSFADSCPKIAFGRMTNVGGRLLLPVSLHAHHALMDGFHAGQFLERFESLLREA